MCTTLSQYWPVSQEYICIQSILPMPEDTNKLERIKWEFLLDKHDRWSVDNWKLYVTQQNLTRPPLHQKHRFNCFFKKYHFFRYYNHWFCKLILWLLDRFINKNNVSFHQKAPCDVSCVRGREGFVVRHQMHAQYLSWGFQPLCKIQCSAIKGLLICFHKSWKLFWVYSIYHELESIQNSTSNLEFKINPPVCKWTTQETLQETTLIPNIYIIEWSLPPKRVVPEPQVMIAISSRTIVGFPSFPVSDTYQATGQILHQRWVHARLPIIPADSILHLMHCRDLSCIGLCDFPG